MEHINRSARTGVTFILSLLPGVGHMYLGLMRRGTEFLVAFFGTIFIISNLLSIPEIGVPLMLVIYFYNIFDARHLNKAIIQGMEVKDEGFLKLGNKPITDYHLGIGIIVIGSLILFNRLLGYGYLSHPIFHALKRSLASLLLMASGVYFIMKSRNTGNTSGSSGQNKDLEPGQ